MTTKFQNAAILEHLQSGRTISFFEAVKLFGVMHLPRRILDLKEAGHDIKDVWERKNGKRYKRWSMSIKVNEQGKLL